MTPSSLSNPTWAKSFLGVAEKEADHSDAKASRLATAKFTDWLQEGPAQGLKRQHLFSRVATGWIPSKTGHQPTTNLSELDDLEGLSPQQLQTALAPAPEADTPLGAQHLANAERADWAVQWATEMQHDPLDWPDETEPLPPISLKMFRSALFSFANGTGLGWDGVHPRALLRLPDELLYRWIHLLLACERSGAWPVQVGVAVVVLPRNLTGGSAPLASFLSCHGSG